MFGARCILILGYVAFVSAVPGQAQDDRQGEELRRRVAERAEQLRPSARVLSWQQIPWLTNLARGLEVAKRERRPVFLWGSDDEPLERC
jgi:hypothetical protein